MARRASGVLIKAKYQGWVRSSLLELHEACGVSLWEVWLEFTPLLCLAPDGTTSPIPYGIWQLLLKDIHC